MEIVEKFIPHKPLETAVLFIVFNRPHTTRLVFQEIRKAKPPRLYIAADGPRESYPADFEKVKEVREYIMSNIDWECEVKTLFREKNLGCKLAPAEAITWFFENEEMGIILEDDCLPSQSFFWFCEELLNKYKEDERIFLISGYNKQNVWKPNLNDYFFSHFGGIWGWASWRRAWKYFDLEMKDINSFIEQNHFENLLGRKLGKIRKKMIYESIILKKIDAWDYQWGYARHKNSGMACVPAVSLIENIGFGEDATHTFGKNMDNVMRHEIRFPIRENKFVVVDKDYDELFFEEFKFTSKILNKLENIFKLFERFVR